MDNLHNLWITCGLLAGLVDPQSPVPEVVQTILWQCLCRSKWSVGVSGDQLDPVSLLPPTVMLLEFLNFDIDR